jgi:hypothetical protein
MSTFQQYVDLFMDSVATRYEINRDDLTEMWKETQKKKFKKNNNKKKTKKSTVPSTYILWSNEERPKIKKENPDFDFIEVARELGRRWKNVEDDVKEHFKEKHDLLLKEKIATTTTSTDVEKTDEEEEVVVASEPEPEPAPEPEPEPEEKNDKPKKTKKPKEIEIPEEITNERERGLWPEFAKLKKAELLTQCEHNNLKKSKNRNDMIHALVLHRIALEDGNTQLDDDDSGNESD